MGGGENKNKGDGNRWEEEITRIWETEIYRKMR